MSTERLFVGLILVLVGCEPAPEGNPSAPDTAPALGYSIPPDSAMPDGPLGASIRRGRALLAATGDSLPNHVGNRLRCNSCHLDGGVRPDASPYVGVYSRFPQYRARDGRVIVLQDRINTCFERSMNGTALPAGGPDMADIVAYMAFLSRGVAPPGQVQGQGFRKMTPLLGDTTRGKLVYVAQCSRCHGGAGLGMDNPDPNGSPPYYPPLWGPASYNIGAGMARLRTAASFIRYNMPYDKLTTLTDQEAFDVAAYVVSRPRPDFAGKENDWPNGNPPPDAAYPTKGRVPGQTR